VLLSIKVQTLEARFAAIEKPRAAKAARLSLLVLTQYALTQQVEEATHEVWQREGCRVRNFSSKRIDSIPAKRRNVLHAQITPLLSIQITKWWPLSYPQSECTHERNLHGATKKE
jgi:hypothetical protein